MSPHACSPAGPPTGRALDPEHAVHMQPVDSIVSRPDRTNQILCIYIIEYHIETEEQAHN